MTPSELTSLACAIVRKNRLGARDLDDTAIQEQYGESFDCVIAALSYAGTSPLPTGGVKKVTTASEGSPPTDPATDTLGSLTRKDRT